MMKKLFVVMGFAISFCAAAQKEKAIAYIDTYKEIAIKEMQRTGVPAAITLAQGVLESQFGESDLSKKSNNHFGIKCKTEWTGEKVYHDDDERGECFRKYPNVEDSYKDHSDFLKNRPYYTSLFKLDPTDYEAWAKGLKECGYATEKNYPALLVKVINDYNLNQYTYIALNKPVSSADSLAWANSKVVVITPAKDVIVKKDEKISISKPTTTIVEDEKDEDELKPKVSSVADKSASASIYPKGVFKINETKVMYVEKGTSLLSLAMENNVSLAKIFEFNELSEMELLDIDRLVFLERKPKKGSTDFYIVQNNENLHDISQKLGIQLQSLADLNGIHKSLNPLPGEKLCLKTKALVPPKASLAKAGSSASTGAN